MRRIRIAALCLPVCGLAALALLAAPAGADATQVQCPRMSLQPAVDAAGNGATLIVTGTCRGTFRVVDKSLTIQAGTGGATLAGPGRGTSPTLLVSASGEEVDLVGLTITGGSGTSGGGIQLGDGTLVVRNTTVSGNHATDGGGIYAGGGELDVINSKLQGNSASGLGGGLAAAGADVSLISTTVNGNTAAGRGGGGISVTGGSLTATAVSVNGNRATASGGPASAIANGYGGGGIRIVSVPVSLVNVTLAGNQSSSFGGGILNSSATLALTGSTVLGNTSSLDGAGVLNLAVLGDAMVVGRGSAISSNTSTTGAGGAVANVGDGRAATLDIAGSVMYGNRASNGDGGAVSNVATGAGSAEASLDGGLSVRDLTLSVISNVARHGGGIYSRGANTSVDVGPGATVSYNSALMDGGGIYNSGGSVTMNGSAVVARNTPNDCVGC